MPLQFVQRGTANMNQVLEAYGQQLQHMKKEITSIQEDLKDWEKTETPQINGR